MEFIPPYKYNTTKEFSSSFTKILKQRGRDSNPRYPFEVYTLSRRAPSTTRPPLCIFLPFITVAQITKKSLVVKILKVNFKPFLHVMEFQR